ncbi:TIGR00730 family Rossman fold protein [Rickettsiella endosymbiont of Dermanyssus gallinae]|uniref:LOG family protein n=1 Tax=Rickettsiella endosymbiont of Dermanyssus gallinae TaxID=2856608 RepID=UPI001C527E0D|nr:TIGR00730 family Rossman fold protein [Rickettsiella endosymbiont of Dermanyssus gallinae]
MKSLCVFLGATIPQNPKFLEATLALGKILAERKVQLVYGGAKIGLMGQLADAVLANGGRVVGVMATVLEGEITHDGLTHLHVTNSLQERKAMMADLSDGFIAMPGGLGTFEEMFEIWNARKIGASKKPLGLLNIDGYFDFTFAQLERGVKEGFVSTSHLALIKCCDDPVTLLDLILSDRVAFTEEASVVPRMKVS